MIKKVVALLCLSFILSEINVSVLASIETIQISIGNTGTSMNVICSVGPKLFAQDPAELKMYTMNAPGWGMLFCLKHRVIGEITTYLTDTVPQWVSSYGDYDMEYYQGHNVVGREYLVAARIDDDYLGNYTASFSARPDQF